MRLKSISQSLRHVVRNNRTFVQEKFTTRRKSTIRVVVKLQWVHKIIRVARFSEIHPWSHIFIDSPFNKHEFQNSIPHAYNISCSLPTQIHRPCISQNLLFFVLHWTYHTLKNFRKKQLSPFKACHKIAYKDHKMVLNPRKFIYQHISSPEMFQVECTNSQQ